MSIHPHHLEPKLHLRRALLAAAMLAAGSPGVPAQTTNPVVAPPTPATAVTPAPTPETPATPAPPTPATAVTPAPTPETPATPAPPTPATADTPAPTPETPPAPATPVTPIPAARIIAVPADPLKADDQVGPIVLSKMPTLQVLDLLGTYSGRVIIPAAKLPATDLTFKSAGTLRRDEAILALETLLSLNGIMLVSQDGKFIRAVPQAQVLRQGPAMHAADEAAAQGIQQVYGRIFDLQHMDSDTMYYQVRNLLSADGQSSILNLNWRNALLIFDTAYNLDAVATVVEMLDQPPQQRAEVFILSIRNSSVASVYNALMHAQRYRANAALYMAHFHIDYSANHLVVVAPPESKAYIEALAGRLDQEIAPQTTSQVFTIRKGNVRTIHGILQGIVNHQQTWFARQGFRSTETSRPTQARPNTPAAPEPEGAAPDAAVQPPAVTPPVDVVISDLAEATAELQFSPYMYIWVDYQNNALVAYGTPADMTRAAALIEQLDQESAPYTTSEIITLNHAFAPGIGELLNHMVQVQRGLFAREGQTSGQAYAAQTGVPPAQNPEEAFEFSPYMYIWSERASNAVLVYGTRSDIERIRAIIQKLDVAQAPITRSKTLEVRNAQAATCANMISQIINMQRYSFMREGLYTGKTREGDTGDTGPTGMETGFEFTPYALVTADRTSNCLFVYGTARDIERVEALLADLDRKSVPITKSKVYYLKHAEADSLGRIVNQVIYSQRRIFETRGVRSGEENATDTVRREAEMAMGFEFSDFATVVADRRSNSLLLYGTASDIARVDEIIRETDIPVEPITGSQVIALKHADANNLSRVLQIIITSQRRAIQEVESTSEKVRNAPADSPAASQGAAEGQPAMQFSQFLSIVPDSRNNALIVYGTHGDLRHVTDLVRQMDVEVAPLTRSEVFFLENARADTLGSILSRMIRGQQAAMKNVQSLYLAVQYPGKDKDGNAAEIPPMLYDSSQPMQFSPYVSVVANDRNNSLLVYGTDSDIGQLRTIINQNDIEVAPRTQSRIFHIRHADANEVVRTINPLITSQQRVREREATLRRFMRRGGARPGEEDAPVAGGATAPAPEAQPETLDAAWAEAGMEFDEDLQFSPYVTLSADDRSNAIIAYGTPFDLQQVGNLIEQIDQVLPQVQIEVVIAEVILDEGQVSGLSSFGVSYDNPFPFQVDSAANGGVLGQGGILGSGPELEPGTGASVDFGVTVNPFSLQTVFRVAEQNSKVRVLSAPTITTTHNRPASINVGEARPIITGSSSSLNSANLTTRSEVEYRDIGIQLKVRPLVSEQGYIQLDIEQTVETVIDTQTIDNNEQPIIGTRRANSFVSVRDQQIIVMGGLQSEVTIDSKGKVWILGDIPLLGRLFRPTKRTSTVRELIIFIRPALVKDMSSSDFAARERKRPGVVAADVVTYLETGSFAGQKAAVEKQAGTNAPPAQPPAPETAPAAKEAKNEQ